MRGRKPDSPELQAAKGYPGKRQSKIARQLAEAEARALMLAEAPRTSGEALAPPAFLLEPARIAALTVWRHLARLLAARNFIEPEDRFALARYCAHYDLWLRAETEIDAIGITYKAKTHGGNFLYRENPAVGISFQASRILSDLERKFGLTERDRQELTRNKFAASTRDPDHQAALPGLDAPAESGALDALDSAPPRLN